VFAYLLAEIWGKAAVDMMQGTNCEACDQPATVHMLVTRHDREMKELLVCKEHLLDPGPLLDW